MRKFFLFSILSFLFFLGTAQAQVPKLLHYQGHLVDGQGIALEGAHELTFRMYEDEVGGIVLWNQTFPQVQMAQGNFAVLLDVSTADPAMVKFDKRYWLSIEVDGDGEMSPRQSIVSSAYSINSDTVDTFHASAAAAANTLLPLNANAKFPQSVLDIQEGQGGQFDADTVDGFHASETATLNTILPLNVNARFPQEVMPIDLDADTVDKKDSTFLLDRSKHTGVQPPRTIDPQGEGSTLNADMLDGSDITEIYAEVDEKIDAADFPDYVDGTGVEAMAPTFRQLNGETRIMKEFSPLLREGIISVDWEMRQDRPGPGAGALYINGTQVRSWIPANPGGSFGRVTETGVRVAKGDIVQIGGTNDVNTSTYIQNARILCANPTQPVEVK